MLRDVKAVLVNIVYLKMLKDWKLKLRYGKSKTPYKHFTLVAPVIIEQYIEALNAEPGKAYAGMKIWALDSDQSAEVFQSVADQTGLFLKEI